MESPAGTGILSHRCVSKLTPGRKTPSRWSRVTSPYAVYTSTPLNSPSPSCLLQLLEWEASAVLADSRPATPLAIRSPNVMRTPGRSPSVADRTPTAANSPLFRRRINRRILESSTESSEAAPAAHPLSPAPQTRPCGVKDKSSSGPGPVRNIQRQRAMVKRFMVTKKKLSQCKIVNDNRGGLRL